MKNWNELRMPKEMKWAEDAQKNKMGQGSLRAMKWAKKAQNSMSTSPMIVLGYWNLESIQQAQKRPNKYKSNNGMAGTTGWHDKNVNRPTKEDKEWIGEGKAHDQARPSPRKK